MKIFFEVIVMFLLIFGLGVDNLHASENLETQTMKITEIEAIKIAQNLMREKSLDKDWNIIKPKIKFNEDKEIGIKFFSRHRFALNVKMALPYLIVINKTNGEIIAFGQDK